MLRHSYRWVAFDLEDLSNPCQTISDALTPNLTTVYSNHGDTPTKWAGGDRASRRKRKAACTWTESSRGF